MFKANRKPKLCIHKDLELNAKLQKISKSIIPNYYEKLIRDIEPEQVLFWWDHTNPYTNSFYMKWFMTEDGRLYCCLHCYYKDTDIRQNFVYLIEHPDLFIDIYGLKKFELSLTVSYVWPDQDWSYDKYE